MEERFGSAALAIAAGDLEALERVLVDEPELISRPSTVSHPTLLQFVACEAANLPDPVGAARVLVAAGSTTEAPLVAAAGCGSFEVVTYLLDVGADLDGGEWAVRQTWTPLDEALYWSNQNMAAYLVGRGARLRALSTAAGIGDVAAIDACFDASGGLTAAAGRVGSPFADTIPEGLADDRQSLVDHAFVMAVQCGQHAAAEAMLRNGAQVNARPPGYHWHGTALHAAAASGDGEMVDWLLDQGADPQLRDGFVDSDAAGWARHHGHPHLIERLTPTS